MPFALDAIRKFGVCGHEVYTGDTFRTAPGSHSSFVRESFIVPSPNDGTKNYIRVLRGILEAKRIEMVVPTFEDVFFISRNADKLTDLAKIFAPPFFVLALLHNKYSFTQFARQAGFRVPRTVLVSDRVQLGRALQRYDEYIARPTYSRGGELILTNAGPLAGVTPLEHCTPTEQNPWIVQEFVHGEELCTFSVARDGKVLVHSTYVHPRMLEHSGGISFESIEASEPLNIVQRIADLTHYTGQISFDFIRGNDGEITLLECNPRPTAGIYLIDPKPFVDAVTGSTSTLSVAPPGIQRHVFSALLREMLVNWRQIPEILTELLAPDASDVYWVAGDRLPSLYQFLSFSHVMKYRKSHSGPKPRSDLLSGYLHDISWNGHALG